MWWSDRRRACSRSRRRTRGPVRERPALAIAGRVLRKGRTLGSNTPGIGLEGATDWRSSSLIRAQIKGWQLSKEHTHRRPASVAVANRHWRGARFRTGRFASRSLQAPVKCRPSTRRQRERVPVPAVEPPTGRCDGDLRREEARGQPGLGSPDAIQPGFTGDQCLQEGATRAPEASRIPTLFDRPRVTSHTDHQVCGRGDPFFSDDELQLPAACGPESGEQRLLTIACLMRSTSRSMWNRNGLARTRPMAAIASRSRSSPPRTRVIGAPCRDDSVTVSTRSVVGTISKPSGRGDDAFAVRRGAQGPSHRPWRLPGAALRACLRNCCRRRSAALSSTAAIPQMLTGCRSSCPVRSVPLGAGEHVVALHQRESAPMTERPRGLPLSRVVLCERVATQAAIRGQRRCSGHALEEAPSAGTTLAISACVLRGSYGRKAALFVVGACREHQRRPRALCSAPPALDVALRGDPAVLASRIALCARVLSAFDTRTS